MGTWIWRTVDDKILIEEVIKGTKNHGMTQLVTELEKEQRKQANALVNHHNRDLLKKRSA